MHLITTYTAANGTRIPGSIVYSTTSTINDKAAVDAHYYAGVVYDYYKTKFNRNSLDGLGMGIKSTVHYIRSYKMLFGMELKWFMEMVMALTLLHYLEL